MPRPFHPPALAAALAALLCATTATTTAGAEPARIGPHSGQPVPRYVSLKFDETNGRRGPGHEHRIDWVYQREGLPVQVIAESGPWRQVRDPDGGEAWVHSSNLAGQRTAYITAASVALRRRANDGARAVAWLERGVVAAVHSCANGWARLEVAERVGWAPLSALWGADGCEAAGAGD